MSKFIMLTGISRGEPLIIRKDDVVSARSDYSVQHREYTTIKTTCSVWNVKESVEEVFVKLEEK